ncbi:MAG: hypothetical protein H3Z52_13555, partial [archaeon]|nr:hypothetical protein [archaeon]
MNKYTKAIMSVLVMSMLFVSATPLMTKAWQEPTGADAASWYKTVNGVLSTDTYELYPYEKKDLTVGFSQFGEMIDSTTNIGLQYGTEDEPGRDPFAPPYDSAVGAMPKYVWLEGWLINITYVHGGKMRNIWATAQHADIDSYEYGNDWVRIDDDYPVGPASESDEIPYNGNMGYFIGTDPAEYGTGGRVTNGTVVTEPIEVLYDGPRRYVARIVNHVYDWVQKGTSVEGATNVHLVDVIITIDFNKVKKQVQLLKDVKLIPIKGVYGLLPPEFWLGKIPDVSPEGYEMKVAPFEGWPYVVWYLIGDVWVPMYPIDIPIT